MWPSENDSLTSNSTATTSGTTPSTTPAPLPSGTPASSTPTASSQMRPNRKVIYVNMVVLDATDAIDRQLQRDFKDIPKPLRATAAKLATTWATPERVAEALSTELPKHLVNKMASKGLTAVAETAFWEGPYVVAQVQILSVSPAAMVEAQSKDFYDEYGDLEEEATLSQAWALRIKSCIQRVLSWMGMSTQKTLEGDYLPWLIESKMQGIMDEAVAGKLQRVGLHAVSRVLTEEKQARYFFETLRQVREAYRPFSDFVGAFTMNQQQREVIDHLHPGEKKVV